MSNTIDTQALAREIVVRYRGTGHVRFGLPAALCRESAAAAVEAALLCQTGVYRATLYRRQGKLSVFYDPHACDLHDVARSLYDALAEAAGKAQGAAGATLGQRLRAANPAPWFKARAEKARARLDEWRFKAKLLKQIVAYHPQMRNVFSERTLLNFLNDLVVFYLIKAHWDMIAQKWIKQPLKYRNAWLSTFYLVFLLVRSRKQIAKTP